MKEQRKTKAQLIQELESLRQEVVTPRSSSSERQAEETLRKEAEIAAALARVGRELIVSLDTTAILDRLCRLTAEVLKGDCSCTVLWQPQDQVYTPVASWGYTPEQQEALRVLRIPRQAAVRFVARLEAEEILQVTTLDSLELLPDVLLQPFGLNKALCLSLWRGQELIGLQVCGYWEQTPLIPRHLRIARGISQVASLALANAKLVEELARANRLKDDFVGTMSHELRTPLHIILGYTELLKEESFGPLTAGQKETLRRLDKSARELLDLIDATLDLGRLQSRRVSLQVQEVEVADLLTELAAESEALNLKSDLRLEWQTEAPLPVLRTDPAKLKIVLKNLITNALKFTEQGTITVTVQTQGEGIEFTVRDTGIGIAPEVLPVIFEPFQRGGSALPRRYGGVGLGLYVVRRLLEVLGGNVSVASEPGKGSTFRAWVPREAKQSG